MSQKELNEEAKNAVINYKMAEAKEIAQKAIAEKADLVDLIQSGYTEGMVEVGSRFEAKKYYLPQVVAAANTMNAAIDLLLPEMQKSGKSMGDGLGRVVICTIEGDIHCIGKNIVAVMLKVAGFNVNDLGRDVAIDAIVQACKDVKPAVVGTSALMTSTMSNQDVLENKLKEAGIRDKLLTNVGGAPTSQEWADRIGADLYTENASDAVDKYTQAVKDRSCA